MSFVLLAACSGGSSDNSNIQQDVANGSTRNITTLAKIDGGGAWYSISVSNERVYFSDMNQGYIQSVPTLGGSVTTHLSSFDAKGSVVNAGGNIFMLEASTDSQLIMLPENSKGVTEIVDTEFGYNVIDLLVDDDSVIWTEYNDFIVKDSRVLRAPINITGSHPVDRYDGFGTDLLTDFNINGEARIALGGDELFILEGESGNIYKLNLATGKFNTLVEGLDLNGWMDLVVNDYFLYSVLNNEKDLIRIDKSTGEVSTSYTTTGNIIRFLKTDSNSIYLIEREGNPAIHKLRRINSETDVISTLYTYEIGVDDIGGIYVDGEVVWIFSQVIMNEPPPVGIYKKMSIHNVSIYGGEVILYTEFDLDMSTYLIPSMNALSADADNLYWLSNRQYYKLAKSEINPVNLPIFEWIDTRKLKTTEDFIITSESDTIYKIPKSGATTPETKWTASMWDVSNLTHDGRAVFWVESDTSPAYTSKVFSANASDGEAQEIKTTEGSTTHIFAYEDLLFLAKYGVEIGRVVTVMPKDGSDEIELINTGNSEINDIFVFNDRLFMLTEGDLISYDLNTFELSILESGIDNAKKLYVDSDYVYWSESPSGATACNVYRKPITEGSTENIFSTGDLFCHAISGDSSHIYLAAGWEILKIDKD